MIVSLLTTAKKMVSVLINFYNLYTLKASVFIKINRVCYIKIRGLIYVLMAQII